MHSTIAIDCPPENPGHKLADEYHNVSTVDQEAVLALAERPPNNPDVLTLSGCNVNFGMNARHHD